MKHTQPQSQQQHPDLKTCNGCGARIIPVGGTSVYDEARRVLSNGTFLCVRCQRKAGVRF